MSEIDVTDELIQQQMENIEKEVKTGQPPIDERRSINNVLAEYSGQQTDEEFTNKAKELGTRFKHIRKVRGDGNCFYRAMLFAVCEQCCGNPQMASALLADVQQWKVRLVSQLGFPDTTTEDFIENFEELLHGIIDGHLNCEQLQTAFNGEMADYFVVCARLLTSGYLQSNADEYLPFLEKHASVKQFCMNEVDPMARECDHMCVTALVNALRTPLHIEYMDRTHSVTGANHHEITPTVGGGAQLLTGAHVTLLYRPGHYDILYK